MTHARGMPLNQRAVRDAGQPRLSRGGGVIGQMQVRARKGPLPGHPAGTQEVFLRMNL